jgi:poly-gamma-glutamate synthesis protein (capsule biosynthesis protein)
MNFTFKHLVDNGILYIGAGENETKAREPKIIERNGIKFAFLGYTDASSMTPKSYGATSSKPGIAWLSEENLKQDIKKAKEKSDVVIVSFHWGTEYQQTPSDRQKNVGRLAIDSGASLVLGHHPHVLQPYEKYKDGYIFYSLGNFVFDQMWSEKTRKGEIAKIYFKGIEIEKVETIPVQIFDYYQPRPD